ncbi:TetR/AcrR family transcriptional regulator [Paenibacillus rhizophilus]|uniref:TetR/AcrR family transcriptional regulator n=1 Tax=Paenibacillus rhizophilus TaxID=1850366 RepID=A0A3N9P9S8_9BACL|nr:TetR/AcrR family transcriptional regulator [Paenibacillus rhizophilus]RQW12405.1 TetR/AcrR family transcriptional regulator [Paenibacillus rhizophilus]
MAEHLSADKDTEQWALELLALGDEEKMTPKQVAILQAAVDVFAEKGYAGAATSEIAQKAGVAEGTIFRYYKTKKDLLLSIVGPTMSRLLAPFVMRNFGNLLDGSFDSYEDFLRSLIRNRLEFARKNFKILQILIQEIPFHPKLREQFMEDIMSKVFERVTAQVDHFKQKGEIIDVPAPTVIRFTASSIIGYIMTRLLLQPDKDWNDEEEIGLLIRFIMHGIAADPGNRGV